MTAPRPCASTAASTASTGCPSGGIEVLDYKTGNPKNQPKVAENLQLTIYALACRDALGLGTPERVTLYFTESAQRMSTVRSEEELDAAREVITGIVGRIRAGEFTASPGLGRASTATIGRCARRGRDGISESRDRYRHASRRHSILTDYDIVDPDPAALIESAASLRLHDGHGHRGLVDNSITARAKNVWVTFYWDGPDSWIRIDDDGLGMSEDDSS